MPTTRSFQDFLTDLSDGQVHEQLTAQMNELANAVNEHSKAGSLTITINLRKEGRQAIVNAKSTLKVPQAQTEATMFYFGQGGLTRQDPKQMILKNVVKEATPLRRVGGSSPSGDEGAE